MHHFLTFARSLAFRFPGLFAANAALSVVLTLIETVALVSLAPVIAAIQGTAGEDSITSKINEVFSYLGIEPSVTGYLAFFAITTVLRELTKASIAVYVLHSRHLALRQIIRDSSEKVLAGGVRFAARFNEGLFINTMTRELQSVGDAFSSLGRMISPVVRILCIVPMAFLISWEVTVACGAMFVLLTMPIQFLNRYVYSVGRRRTDAQNRFTSVLGEVFSQLRVIVGYGKEEEALEKMADAHRQDEGARVRVHILTTLIQTLYSPIGVLVVVCAFIISDTMSVPLAKTSVVIYTFHRLSGILQEMATYRVTLIANYPSYQQLSDICDKAVQAQLSFGERPFTGLGRGIELKNVSFSYKPADFEDEHVDGVTPLGLAGAEKGAALEDVTLEVLQNSTTALVGQSGSGKSTLADIVLGFQRPDSGTVLINGEPLEQYDVQSYRHRVGFVPQRVRLFDGTIAENLRWANSDASMEDIEEACRKAHAHEFIIGLRGGYDFVVKDGGGNLSGGQAQRIALARALVRKPELLVLDEATSALDAVSESAFQAALREISESTAVLVIAHRMATVANARRIYVLEGGRVVEHGTHESLMRNNRAFAQLVRLQQL